MNRPAWWLLAILLLATGLRLLRAGGMSLRADEAANFFLALKEPGEIIRTLIVDDPHQPLYYLLLNLWTRVAGNSELAIRFPTILAGVAIVALVYVLGREIFPHRPSIAIVAATLAAINPSLIWDAQDAYMYALLSATTLVAFIAFLRAMQANGTRVDWFVYVLANVAGLYLHYFAVFAMMAQGAVWLLLILSKRVSRRRALVWCLANVVVLLLFLPWLFFAFPLLSTFTTDFLPSFSLDEMLMRSLTAFTVGRTDARLLPAMIDSQIGNLLAVGFLAIFVYGLVASKKNDWLAHAMLVIYLAGALVAIVLFSRLRFPIFDERYILFLTPAFVLILSRGLVSMHAQARWRWIAALAFGFIVLASTHSLANYFYVPAFAKSPDWRGFVQRLIAEAQPGDVLIQNYPDPALPYYLDNRMPRILLPRSSSSSMAQVHIDMTRLADKYARLWFQPVPFATWDIDGLVMQWLNRHARQIATRQFQGAMLSLYRPAPLALADAKPIDVIFANRVRLLAFEAKTNAKPGTTAQVTLYWQLIRPTDQDATVFVHLYDSSGQLWAQQDNAPVNGTFPTNQWQTDSIVVDSYVLGIPVNAPAGVFSLVAGMYDSQTHMRLAVANREGRAISDDRVVLTTVEVR